jgi:sarcosine oxidase subunit alpha
MDQSFRLPAGGRVERHRRLAFTFDGRALSGLPGDTLASALLANGVHLVGRSLRYHRPRGILSAGVEEPNALVQVGTGALVEPNARATVVELYDGLEATSQGGWPSVDRDLAAVADMLAPDGFAYRTRWPVPLWMRWERRVRRRASGGRAPARADAQRYDRRHAHCDVLVVGAGPAGIAAALAAGRAGARVILADEQMEPGGRFLGERSIVGGRPAVAWVRDAVAELARLPEVRRLPRTTVFGYYDHNYLAALERVTDHLGPAADPRLPRHRLWTIRAREAVLATGGIERPLVFADNDRPGVMLAAAVRTYVNRFAVAPGRRAVVVTNNDDAYRTALDLHAAGLAVGAVVDVRAEAGGALVAAVRAAGIDVVPGHTVRAVRGRTRVQAVELAPAASASAARGAHTIECDLVAISGGWAPAAHLYSQSRGTLRYDESSGAFVPASSPQAVRAVGTCAGSLAAAACLAEGFAAGAAAARACGFGDGVAPAAPSCPEPPEERADPRAAVVAPPRARRRAFVDFFADVTAADIQLASDAGFGFVEHLKRYTTAATGPDQGKTSALNALVTLAEVREIGVPEVGHTTFRPPYTPVTLGAIAGRDVGPLLDAVRRTPMHAWHEPHGAVFENVGQWKRPWYYLRDGEVMGQAVAREVRAARARVALLDASTLGKIDVQGPDAGTFLDRIYTNRVSSLAAGRCRYGLMLGEDGMVMDDGVVTRLGPDHFLVSTTTGNAARVLAWLEEWLQTEWPSLRVYCTSVTEQYAVAAIVGPRARDVLRPLTDVDLDPARFGFMSVRDGRVAEVPARVFRVSFTGELSYEVTVPADRGLEVWEAIVEEGRRWDITPHGTEALHVLRCEKGYIAVGHETDGSVTPGDLGMEALCAKDKDFIGRRSLRRADTTRPDRKQLVGLQTDDPHEVLPEGAQLVADLRARPPMTMVGHVTSSYWSPTCGRSIAMALVRNGRALLGRSLHVPLADRTPVVTVVEPRFFDPEGVRLRG